VTRQASARTPARRAAVTGVRWDRLGRIAMLVVLAGLAYLYVGAVRSYITTYRQSNAHHDLIVRLERENAQLSAKRGMLMRASTLQRDARELGMIAPGERPYIVQGLRSH
jgi:cell division protein FtsB